MVTHEAALRTELSMMCSTSAMLGSLETSVTYFCGLRAGTNLVVTEMKDSMLLGDRWIAGGEEWVMARDLTSSASE